MVMIMNKYQVKKIIKYSILIFLLLICTKMVYVQGKNSYQKYIDSHEQDLVWVEENITLEDNYKIGSNVKVVNMPANLTVSDDNYTKIVESKIKKLLVAVYSIDSPLLIYNPYLEDENSLYIYFYTGGKYKAQYYVSTSSIVMQELNTIEYQDFIMDASDAIFTSRHYYRLDSLVPGQKNNIIIRLVDEQDNVIAAENFILNIPSQK